MPRPEDEYSEDEIKEDTENIELDSLDLDIGKLAVDSSQTFDQRIECYRTAKNYFDINFDTVYEPANGSDVSTAEAFPEASVIFAEVNDAAVEQLKSEGYDIRGADAENLHLDEDIGLTVFRNAAVDALNVLELNSSEWVFANDYLNNASEIQESPNYEVVGVIDRNTLEIQDTLEEINPHPDDLYVFRQD